MFLKVVSQSSPWNADGTLEVYSSSLERWTAVTLDHCKIRSDGIGEAFAVWDTVTIQGTAAAAAACAMTWTGKRCSTMRERIG